MSSSMSSTTTTTSALVLREVGAPVILETINLAELQPNEALVEIHATGVCHTDLSCIDGTLPAALPNVLGHEGSVGS
jgi:Zn-dependent alcohol dehydrogenase